MAPSPTTMRAIGTAPSHNPAPVTPPRAIGTAPPRSRHGASVELRHSSRNARIPRPPPRRSSSSLSPRKSPRQHLAPLPSRSTPPIRNKPHSLAEVDEANASPPSASPAGPSSPSPPPTGQELWEHAHDLYNDYMDESKEVERAKAKEEAKVVFRRAKAKANESWSSGRFDECLAALDTTISIAGESDVLHRFRSRCHSRQGGCRAALQDARDATQLSPRGPANFYVLGQCLERSELLGDSAAAYLSSMAFGQVGSELEPRSAPERAEPELLGPDRQLNPRGGVEGRYSELLAALRRKRAFPVLARTELSPLHGPYDKTNETWTGRRHASIFDPRKKLEAAAGRVGGDFAATAPDAPMPVLLGGAGDGAFRVARDGSCACVIEWEEPDDGGEEIYLYTLELQRHEVKWDSELSDLFDDFRPWELAYQGPARVRRARLEGLNPRTEHRVRLRCRNGAGESEWSVPLEFETPANGAGHTRARDAVPKSWLRVPLPDVLLEHTTLVGGAPERFLFELGAALQPYVHEIRLVFKLYAASGGIGQSVSQLSALQFGRFARDAGLTNGLNPHTGERNGLKPLPSPQLDLLFKSCVTRNVDSRTKAWEVAAQLQQQAQLAVDDATRKLEKAQRASLVEASADGADGAALVDRGERDLHGDDFHGMGLREFVAALVRMAWATLPRLGGVGERVTALLVGAVLPAMRPRLLQDDPMAAEVGRARVRAITAHYDKELRQIFNSYAAADMQISAQDAMGSVNLSELMYMLKEGKLIDESLSASRVLNIFQLVNTQEEEEGGDEDESELVYDELVQVVVRICDAKIPEASRGGEPFEYTLQSWLQLIFLPTYRKLLKDKAHGKIAKNFS